MNIILWILFGALAGWIASLILNRDSEQGVVGNIIVGILGAIIGGMISRAFGGPDVSGFNLMSLVIAVLGSVLLLLVMGAVRGRTSHRI